MSIYNVVRLSLSKPVLIKVSRFDKHIMTLNYYYNFKLLQVLINVSLRQPTNFRFFAMKFYKMKKILLFLFIVPLFVTAQDKMPVAEGITPNLYINHTVASKENFYSIGRIYNVLQLTMV